MNGSIPATPTINALGSGFNLPSDVAVDESGKVFVADTHNNEVKEILVGGNFGFVNVGSSATNPVTFNFTFGASVTLGPTAVLTQGAAHLDFTDAGGSTCTAKTYTTGATCGVNVTFKPTVPGPRYGAAVLQDSSGNALATGDMQGTGIGPRVNFLPGTQSTVGSLGSFFQPVGVAVDGSGNVYVADRGTRSVKEALAPNYTTVNTLASGFSFSFPVGLAVDGSGNVYFSDQGSGAVKEILAVNGSIPANPTIVSLASGFSVPSGVAVDGNGNVFVTDQGNSAVKEILAVNGSIPATPTINTLGSGFSSPAGVAVDQYGDVFVADTDNSEVKEILEVNGSIPANPTIITLGSGFSVPTGVAVDGNGNVYVADQGNSAVKEILALSYTTVNTLGGGFFQPVGVAVDGKGNVYVSDYRGTFVEKLDFADPPSLSFATTAEGSTSTDSPKTVTVENGGNATLTFPTPATGTNPLIFLQGYMLDHTTTCPQLSTNSSPGTLDPGDTCTYAVDFSPTLPGNFAGPYLVLTDNNLNAPSPSYATQIVALSGTATAASTFVLNSSLSSLTVSLGTSGTTTITVTPIGGFTGNVALTAVFSSTPPGTTVVPIPSLSPTNVSVTGASPGTSTLTISTTAPTSAVLVHPERPSVPWYAAGLAALAGLLIFGMPAPRRRWRTVLAMAMLLVALTGGVLGCTKAAGTSNPGTTGGSGSGGSGGTSTLGTTPGTYTVTVTGTSGAITQTTVFTLVVTSSTGPVTQTSYKLVFQTQPPAYNNTNQVLNPAVVVQVQDASGNLVTGSSAPVSISSTPAGLVGNLTVIATAGVATFNSAWFTRTANFTLTASSPGIASATSSLTVGNHLHDWAGNGRSGALLYDPVSGQAYTALSNGDGTYQYVSNILTPSYDTLLTGDFNGDGKADLIVYNSTSGLAYIGFGKGDGTFNFQSLSWNPGYDFVEAGDINGDGKTDVFLYNSTIGSASTGISNGDGTFTYQGVGISTGFTFVRLADFTGNGKADLFMYASSTGNAYTGISNGSGGFTYTSLILDQNYNLLDIGDLNGDGKADLILYNSSTGGAFTGIGNGSGGFSTITPLTLSSGFTSVRLADYSGNGLADVTLYNNATTTAFFGTGTGTGTFNFQSMSWSAGYNNVVPEDVNGDGKVDVILYNNSTGTEYTGISNGDGTFSYTYQDWSTGRVLAQ